MKIAVVGHGRMGREVEAVLCERGHEAVIVARGAAAFPTGCAAGIDFTRPDAVAANVGAALTAGMRYVVGTTGWDARLDDVRAAVAAAGGGLVYGPNFSLGVNVFFRLVQDAARRLAALPDYDPYVLERHHRLKRDAPSGTAKTLAHLIETAGGRRQRAEAHLSGDAPLADDAFHVAALRAGGIVGEHVVGWDSGGDEILLEHRARNRRGFALGAVLAAEWIATRTGFHAFDVVVDALLAGTAVPGSTSSP